MSQLFIAILFRALVMGCTPIQPNQPPVLDGCEGARDIPATMDSDPVKKAKIDGAMRCFRGDETAKIMAYYILALTGETTSEPPRTLGQVVEFMTSFGVQK